MTARTGALLSLLMACLGGPALAQDPVPSPVPGQETVPPKPAPGPDAAEPPPAANAASTEAPASDDASELELFKLDATLNKSTQVASTKATTFRESPGIISVITHQEIVEMGARDLLDVLMRVPGFAPGVDVEGAVDVGIRGNWGHEGKILLLWDGLEQNENLYSTLQLGNHYPVDQIDSVEIIRGPGSAAYGGYAELAVINVHTRAAKDLEGVSASAQYGEFPTGLARRDVSVMGGHTFSGAASDLRVDASVFIGQGNRSSNTFTGSDGSTLDMANASRLDPTQINVGIRWKDLKLRFFYDNYWVGAQDGYGTVDPPVAMRFRSIMGDAQYEIHLGDKIRLIPRATFQSQRPWEVLDSQVIEFYRKTANRARARLTFIYDILENLNLNLGVEGYVDHAYLINEELVGSQTSFGGKDNVTYEDFSGFAEVLWQTIIGNLVAGARYELHSSFGSSFVPRVGLTKVIGRFHFKALYSEAYRAPGIEDINDGTDIKPEHTTDFELELGYQLTDHMFLSVNGFDTTIRNPIVYEYDQVADADSYKNEPRTGTNGVEAEYRLSYPWLTLQLSYSFYATGGKNQVELYAVPGQPQALLGMPQHKWTAEANVPIWKTLSLHGSAIVMSPRSAYGQVDENGNAQLIKIPTTTLIHAYLLYQDLGTKGLNVGVGVYNLLNQANWMPQPYQSGHPPLPGPNREILLRVAYDRLFN